MRATMGLETLYGNKCIAYKFEDGSKILNIVTPNLAEITKIKKYKKNGELLVEMKFNQPDGSVLIEDEWIDLYSDWCLLRDDIEAVLNELELVLEGN